MKTWRICVFGLACALCFLPVALALGIRSAKTAKRTVEPARGAPESLKESWSRRGREVSISFDRPVIAPGKIGSPAPMHANANGSARWTGVASAVFTPDAAWRPSFDVRLTMDEVVAFDG
ncbi:MAG: hypothetical protein K8T20_10095, partial [Planctomycetes bacterium]|nr:hypothetical protein [Planctomycetota bacterium]